MSSGLKNTDRMCLHTITTKPWSIEIAVEQYARAGIRGITIWRDTLEGRDLKKVRRRIKDAGLEIVSLCRGGFFPSADSARREAAVQDNLEAVRQAEALGAPSIVLVPGADPSQSLEESRRQIGEGIGRNNRAAEAAGVKLSIEPLHPMYADTRSAINTLAQANEMCDQLAEPNVGVAVDVYHLWWDPSLQAEIERSAEHNRLFAFHVCDWLSPTVDLLNDRGLMGEGCIPVPEIRGWMETAGFDGFIEVEIFSTRRWSMDQSRNLMEIREAYLQYT